MQRQCRMELRISTATTVIQWKSILGGNELDHSYPTDFAIMDMACYSRCPDWYLNLRYHKILWRTLHNKFLHLKISTSVGCGNVKPVILATMIHFSERRCRANTPSLSCPRHICSIDTQAFKQFWKSTFDTFVFKLDCFLFDRMFMIPFEFAAWTIYARTFFFGQRWMIKGSFLSLWLPILTG